MKFTLASLSVYFTVFTVCSAADTINLGLITCNSAEDTLNCYEIVGNTANTQRTTSNTFEGAMTYSIPNSFVVDFWGSCDAINTALANLPPCAQVCKNSQCKPDLGTPSLMFGITFNP